MLAFLQDTSKNVSASTRPGKPAETDGTDENKRTRKPNGKKGDYWGTILYIPTIGIYMSDATLDDRGRLTLPKEIRERYGDRYHVVDVHDGIKLIPVAEDPLEALRDEFDGVEKTAEKLRAEAREASLDEAGR
jgi:bifunctional DNA-binding transcriptional regulator/antitoxin component of YhaV-PrlF toxin-antitoxin module